jgi:uroporphyrinogen decarboxylase
MRTDHSPSFDRILTALHCEEPDRVPPAELWVDPSVKSSLIRRPVQTLEDDVVFWTAAGYDFITLDSDLWATPQIQDRILTPTPDTSQTYERGSLERNWVTSEAGVIKTWEDIDSFTWPKAKDLDYSQYDEVQQYLPLGMKVLVTFGHVFTSAWQLMGFENFCVSLLEETDLVKEIFNRIGEETLIVLEKILSYDVVGAVCFQDDIAYTNGLMVHPKWLREFFFPWLTEATQIAHARGRPLIYHSDGKLDDVLPDIIATSADAIQAIEPKCMDIYAVKREYGNRLALMGNIDLGYTLTRGSPSEVEEEVKNLIKHVAPGGGLLLGSTNSITNYVLLENYQAMLDATFKYGRYPISI